MKTYEKVCSHCGETIILPPKYWKDTPAQADVFCSPACIDARLLNNIEANMDMQIRKKSKDVVVSEFYSNFSSKLNMNFRSEFEVVVAEYLYKHGSLFWYEKITLELFDGTKHWTPDFYIPDARTFMEVKGVWAFGGKRKYQEATRTIEEEIIFIPYWMKKLFREAI